MVFAKRRSSHRKRSTQHEVRQRRSFERLEERLLLVHGPTFLPDGSVEIGLDDTFDQFGFQPAVFQAYDATPANGTDDALASFSIFDTGASVVTFGATDQVLFDLLGTVGIPIGVECGAIAEAVGGLSLVGHISRPGTVLVDGLHVSSLTFDNDGFPVFDLGFNDPESSAVADPSPTSGSFRAASDLSSVDDTYNGSFLAFTTGVSRGAVREVIDYDGATRGFQFTAPFSEAPSAGDRFVLIADETPFVGTNDTGIIEDTTPAADQFQGDTSLLTLDNAYEGLFLQFTSGNLAGEMQQITDYIGATRTFFFADPYSAAPGEDTFRILQINTTPAAIAPDIQGFVGTQAGTPPARCPDPASPTLPTLAGTPMLNPSTQHPSGLAVNIRPFGAFLDFSDFAGFEGLVIPVPDVQFQDPGLGIPHDPACLENDGAAFRNICTETIRVPLSFVGAEVDEVGQMTEAFNPVQKVTVRHVNPVTGDLVERTDQVFLFDTGAQLSVISTAQAVAFGLDLNSPEDTISVQTAGGVITDLPGYRIESISIPTDNGKTLTFKNVWVFVVDAAAGLLDGIMGMNLFNNASAMLYDPFHSDGAVLELSYFTEHLFDFPFAEIIEIEPNQAPASATPLRPGEFGSGELINGDEVDFWASPGANAGDLVFAYVDPQRSNSSRDATLTVIDRELGILGSDDNDGPGPAPVVAGVAVPTGLAGTVFYEVREAGDDTISEYQIFAAVVDSQDAADEGETGIGANDTRETAVPISRALMNGELGSAVGSGDVDFYRLLAAEGTRIVVMMDNDPDKDGALTATSVSILDPNGTEIFPATTGDGDGNATAAGAVIQAPFAGEYRIRIAESPSGTDNDYRFVAQVLDGGLELLSGNLVFSAEARQAEAEQTVAEYEQALSDCLGDIFCEIDVITDYQVRLLEAAESLAESATVMTLAHTISGSAMPTFVNIGNDLGLSLTADAMSESDGVITATVRRSDTAGDLTVVLEVDDDSEATVVESVVIPDGQRVSAPFTIEARDDMDLDGSQFVKMTASTSGYEPGVVSFEVTDFESLTLSITDDSVSEGGSTGATVTRTDLTGDLEIMLLSSDTSKATVVETIVIADGQLTSPSFAINTENDASPDGDRNVTITASAPGYQDSADSLDVLDDDNARTMVRIEGGDLKIESADGVTDSNDQLTISRSAVDLIFSDPTRQIGSEVDGAAGNGTNELRVPLSAFTGQILIDSSNGDDLIIVDATVDASLATAMAFRGGAGRDGLEVHGAELDLQLSHISELDRINISGSGSNTLRITKAAAMDNVDGPTDMLVVESDADDTLEFDDGWSLTGTRVVDGQFFRVIEHGDAALHLAGPRGWQNPLNGLDANIDQFVTSNDALVIINEINDPTVLGENGLLVDPATLTPFPDLLFDVDGNGFGTPADVLKVINFLNSVTDAESEDAAALRFSATLPPTFGGSPSRSTPERQVRNERLKARLESEQFVLPDRPMDDSVTPHRVPRRRAVKLLELTDAALPFSDGLDQLIDQLAADINTERQKGGKTG
jgi:hypothetical protein